MESFVPQLPITDAVFTEEIWVQKNPVMGDHIRVKRMHGIYTHHGIYVSDNEVIHFTGTDDDSIMDSSKNRVISSDLNFFLKGGELEVKEYTDEEFQDLYAPDQIVAYARSCLGDDGYNLIFNNCEHFANVCTLGRFRSHQVERLLQNKGVDDMKRTEISIFDSIEDMEVFIAKNARTIEVISITPNKYRKSYDSIYPSDYIMVYKNKEGCK